MNKTTIVNSFDGAQAPKTQSATASNYKSNNDVQPAPSPTSFSTELDSPFLFASKEVFRETYRLMHQNSVDDVAGISMMMGKQIDAFSNIAMEQGVENDALYMGRYILCTFIDEMLGNASWVSEGQWGNVSLLNRYYQQTYGGDRFFGLLKQFEEQPTKYIYLMELAYVCLSFGYGGQYKKKENSIQDLGAIKENLYRQIKTTRPKKEKFYANHPAAQRHHKLYSKLSRKIILAVSLLLMVVIYGVFTYTVQSNETALIELIEEEYNKVKDGSSGF